MLRNTLLLMGSLLFGLVVAEGMVRVFAPQQPTPAFIFDPTDSLHRPDPELGRVLQPNLDAPFVFGTRLRTNSLGLRDREFGPKQTGELRILSLGDSYAMGYGVEIEQSYGRVLERDLGPLLPTRKVMVVNAGLDGYGTQQIMRSFARVAPRFQPDLVLATFVAGNDVDDNAMFEARLRTHLNRPLGPLAQHSQALQLLLKTTFPLWFFLSNRNPGSISQTIDLLRQLEASFRAAHLPCLMLVIPARHQIRPQLEPPTPLLMRFAWGRRLVFRQNQAVIAHFRRDQVPYLDTWPALVRADSSRRVSFPKDSHLNAYGHEVVAREILARLREGILDLPQGTVHGSCGQPDR